MIPHTVEQVLTITKGKLIQGNGNNVLYDAAYRFERLTQKNTVLFLRMQRSIDWKRLLEFTPLTFVTNNIFPELQAFQDCPIIQVNNIDLAYWSFVDYYRNLFDIPFIAVTGTCGKTSTKELIKHILEQDRKVQATRGSANSRLQDLPYLLGIDKTTKAAVIETAVGRPGDLAEHCRYFKPSIGIITNIGVYHLDECKTVEAYINAKAEMLDGLDNKGTLILNADDENTKTIKLESFKGKIVYIGLNTTADYLASQIEFAQNGMKFILNYRGKKYPVFVPGYGEHQVYNALTAIAAVHEVGVEIEEATKRLRSYKNFPRYMEVFTGIKGSTLIDDTFLTNPTSIKAALKLLDSLARGKKKIAVLGEVNRLGEHKVKYHQIIGEMVAENSVDVLFTIGRTAAEIGRAAIRKGYRGQVESFETMAGVHHKLTTIIDEKSIVLVKGYAYDKAMVALAQKLKAGYTTCVSDLMMPTKMLE
ncbi:UDP-N-acetylmuramoyl-tripeptide--D-alanyl-D-alanine ligase [Sporotomaculum syntrophicum]|uniref:UDP-N-acetylmuramoyl-tripeptide--D-alanyl-D-alanine ligase n=1 Tax=Sporotomaculum syntrophicum TaxID=182264 RepID=A0A9D2WN56_9FIRM|nr:UDP-N-acetylmuramoyl-tripeptide--D-alanyl-D-alanine ligase [Sporotomaculum syntrophicum]KAF1083826.1 UDP-N-acetylmuramoyl-tripeptide--D-alanyl-D-alanine ligase [Sporotomaculum syntrophicum]